MRPNLIRISPGQSNAGIIPADITSSGRIGLVSKSGTLTYQMMYELRDIGFSTCVGIGGDPVIGTTHIDCLQAFQDDPDTDAIVMIGEIGGDAEERAADYIRANITKPVVAYVAGFTAPEGKTMGHAGAIVSGSSGTAGTKKAALEAAGVKVGKTPSETAHLAHEIVPNRRPYSVNLPVKLLCGRRDIGRRAIWRPIVVRVVPESRQRTEMMRQLIVRPFAPSRGVRARARARLKIEICHVAPMVLEAR